MYGFQWRHFGAEYKDRHADYTGTHACALVAVRAHMPLHIPPVHLRIPLIVAYLCIPLMRLRAWYQADANIYVSALLHSFMCLGQCSIFSLYLLLGLKIEFAGIGE